MSSSLNLSKIDKEQSGLAKSRQLLSPRTVNDPSKAYNKHGIKPDYHKPKGSIEVLRLEATALEAFNDGKLDYFLSDSTNLDYPCNDNSTNITDFRQWSYFTKRAEKHSKVKIVNMDHSFVWNSSTLDRIKQHYLYEQIPKSKESTLSQAKQTKIQRERMMRAKKELAIWKRKLEKDNSTYVKSISKADADSDASSMTGHDGKTNTIFFPPLGTGGGGGKSSRSSSPLKTNKKF